MSQRSYQDTPYPDFQTHANIPAELANVRPHGDFVLVRVIPEPEKQGSIVIPTGSREKGYQPPRMAEVIAVGEGDRVEWRRCLCGRKYSRTVWNMVTNCKCGRDHLDYWGESRHPMHVKPGDRILFWRAPANGVVLNGEHYQFLHEEQHILGVLE